MFSWHPGRRGASQRGAEPAGACIAAEAGADYNKVKNNSCLAAPNPNPKHFSQEKKGRRQKTTAKGRAELIPHGAPRRRAPGWGGSTKNKEIYSSRLLLVQLGFNYTEQLRGRSSPCTTFPPVVTPQNLPHRHRGIIHWVLIFQNPTGTNMQLYSSVMQHRIGSRGGDRVTASDSGESFPA